MLLESDPLSDGKLHALQSAGMQLALDNFGTGYSSLSYLKRFDIDYIKIGRSFVSHLSRNSQDLVLCQAIIAMAHQLGIHVVAEGVETQEQHDILLAAGWITAKGTGTVALPAQALSERLQQQPSSAATPARRLSRSCLHDAPTTRKNPMQLQHFTIGTRLRLGFGLVLLITALITALGLWRLHDLAQFTEQLATRRKNPLAIGHAMAPGDCLELGACPRSAVRARPHPHCPVGSGNGCHHPRNGGRAQNAASAGNLGRRQALVQAIDSARDAFRSKRAELLKRKAAGEDISARIDTEIKPLAEAFIQKLVQLQQRQQTLYEQAHAQAMARAAQSRTLLLAAALAALLLGMGAAAVIRALHHQRAAPSHAAHRAHCPRRSVAAAASPGPR